MLPPTSVHRGARHRIHETVGAINGGTSTTTPTRSSRRARPTHCASSQVGAPNGRRPEDSLESATVWIAWTAGERRRQSLHQNVRRGSRIWTRQGDSMDLISIESRNTLLPRRCPQRPGIEGRHGQTARRAPLDVRRHSCNCHEGLRTELVHIAMRSRKTIPLKGLCRNQEVDGSLRVASGSNARQDQAATAASGSLGSPIDPKK